MGQKAHPYGLRLGYIKPWKAKWFAPKNAADLLEEDLKFRKYLKDKLGYAGISNIEIERSSGRVRVRIYTARPGVIIGRRGQEIDKVKDDLSKLTQNELFVDIKEIKLPQADAQLVAENLALQLEKRASFRRTMKKALQLAMSKGALGIKITCKGRLGGSEIARTEKYRDGSVPLNTFRADVDYGFAEAFTTYGTIGCKVWVYKGDVLVKKEEAEQRKERERKQMERGEESEGVKGKKAKKAKEAKKEPKKEEVGAAAEDKAAPAPTPIATEEEASKIENSSAGKENKAETEGKEGN